MKESSESTSPDQSTVTTEATTVVGATPVEATANSTAVTTASDSNTVWKPYVIAAIVILLMGLALWYVLEKQDRVQTGVIDRIENLGQSARTAIVVNDEEISMAKFNKSLEQMTLQAKSQGLDVNSPEVQAGIKQQTIDSLVNSTLLTQAAAKAGIVATDEQVNARYQEIATSQGGEAALDAEMKKLGISQEELRQDIHDEIVIQTYLSEKVDLSTATVADAEVTELYDTIKASQTGATAENFPPLDDKVKEEIMQNLKASKEQELVGQYLETLKSEAVIEISV